MIDRRDRSPAPSLVHQCLPPSPLCPCLPSDRRAAPARAPADLIWTSSAASRSCWRWAGTSAARPSGNPVLDALQWPGHTFGWAGVDLFFVLSGFLMGQLVLRERRADRPVRRPAVHRAAPAAALAGALRLPRRPCGPRRRTGGVLSVAERPPRAELRGDVAGAPVVARGRGALLPAARRPLPAVRPAPLLRAPARGCARRRPRRLPGAAGLRRRDRGQRGAAAVADALPHGRPRRRGAARRPPGARPRGVRAPRPAALAVGRGDRRRGRLPRHRRQERCRWGARWATRSRT